MVTIIRNVTNPRTAVDDGLRASTGTLHDFDEQGVAGRTVYVGRQKEGTRRFIVFSCEPREWPGVDVDPVAEFNNGVTIFNHCYKYEY